MKTSLMTIRKTLLLLPLASALAACSSTTFGGSSSKAAESASKEASPVGATIPPAASPSSADATSNPQGGVTPQSSPGSGSTSGSISTGGGVSQGTVTTGGSATAGFPIGTISVKTATAPSYANTASQLYSYNPANGALPALIGAFNVNGTAVTNVYDTAIDMAGHLFAVTPTDLYVVDPTTATMTHLLAHNVRNAMGLTCLSNGAIVIAGDGVSFVNPQTLAEQVLVPAGRFMTSGDVVALPDHNIYWTVNGFLGDSLVVINPLTGAMTTAGNTGVTGIFGLSYAGGVLSGFVKNGDIVTINPTNGQVLTHVPGTGSQSWDGATTNPVLW